MFRNDAIAKAESDKLVDLFRNRIELKKEFAALRAEKYELEDAINRHLQNVARVEQKLGHLEGLLLDPDWVHNIAAFYQLRAVSDRCHNQLKLFAEQLKQKREEQQYSKLLSDWQRRRSEKAAETDEKIKQHQVLLQHLEDDLERARQRLATMSMLAKLFRGRSAAQEIDDIIIRIESEHRLEADLLSEQQAIEKMRPPGREGLDLTSKRQINFQILAFAQYLYLKYERDNLARLAKEASEKTAGAIRYGDKASCEQIMMLIEESAGDDDPDEGFAGKLAERASLVARQAAFRHDEDVVPVPASVSSVFDIDNEGTVAERQVAILAENYFGVGRVLIR
jgi:hypothetical protein